jgi:hypothetical protein
LQGLETQGSRNLIEGAHERDVRPFLFWCDTEAVAVLMIVIILTKATWNGFLSLWVHERGV